MEKLQFNNHKEQRKFFEEQAIERIGETRINNFGSLMTIDEYRNSQDITVRFIESGYVTDSTYGTFVRGQIKSPYDRSVFNIGYLGEGKYKAKINGESTPQYQSWKSMLMRCYSEKFQNTHLTYRGCIIADEWLNFQNYAMWYDNNYYEIDGQRMEIEKDILSGDIKIYSPDTCVFVPKGINMLFVKRDALRGDLPIGVRQNGKHYQARCNTGKGEQISLGTYQTPEEAHHAYKQYKEQLIKETAKQYKGLIPDKLYTAMLNYEVKITD